MKKTTLFAGALLALSAPTAAQWSDNFESYPANQVLSNVGGWFGWDNVPAAAGTVDASLARSFPNSIRIGPTGDAVQPALGITSGKWRVTGWQYIPTGGLVGGDIYFIINNRYSHGGPYTWTVQLKADRLTGMVHEDQRAGDTPQPIVFDRWVEYRIDIDLDANTMSQYYNGGLLLQSTYSTGTATDPRAIENIDLFNNGGTCNWDDLSIAWRGDAFETYLPATLLSNVGGWFGWDNTPAAAGTVDATRARSAPNSILIGATADAVHPGIGITSGRHILTAWQYIATGGLTAGSTYFIVNNNYTHGGPYNWAVELQCTAAGMVIDDLRPHTPQPVVFDQWAEYRLVIDLDTSTVITYYNGALLSQGPWTGSWAGGGGPVAIANIDLFATGGICNWDDICIQRATLPPCYETDIGTSLALIDDQTVARPLGFTFPFPGGSTTDISICSNGFIWLDGVQTGSNWSNSVNEFLGSVEPTPRICAFWRDLNPAIGPGNVFLRTFADRAVITWHSVRRFGGTVPMTVQCQMLSDGSVYMYYDVNYDLTGGTANSGRTLIGIKAPTGLVADPGNTDYTGVLPSALGSTMYEFFSTSANFDLLGRCLRFIPNLGNTGYDVSFRADCPASAVSYGVGCPAGTPMTLASATPPVLGATFTWDVTNVPATTTAAALLLGFGRTNISLDGLGFTGCSAYNTMDLPVALPFTPPTATLMGPVPANPQLLGMVLHTQAAVVENNNGPVKTSNGLTLVFGKN